MIHLTRRTAAPATDQVALAFDDRKRSRLRVILQSGVEAGIFLGRGEQLRHGERLATDDGALVVAILAAPEELIEARASDTLLFARAAYHLGNRHVPVELIVERVDGNADERTDGSAGGRLRFQTDHVLADMLRGLGCSVVETVAPFQPEAGAYGGGHVHDDGHPYQPGHGAHRSMPKIHEFKP